MSASLLLTLALAGDPSAEAPDRDELVAEAVECFEHEDYACSTKAFAKAYALNKMPVDLYNIARVYEESGQPDRARRYYERFLEDPSLGKEHRAQGEARLAALPEPEADDADEVDEATGAAASVTKPTLPPPAPARPGRRAVIAGATLLPVGVVSLIAGTGLAVAASRNADNAEISATPEQPATETPHYAMARRQAISSDVLLGVGGVMTAASVAVLVVGLRRAGGTGRRARRDSAANEPRVAIAPQGAGVRLHVRF